MSPDRPWIVGIDWLGDRLDTVRVVDVRDEWEYQGIGHIPGALSLPFDSFRSADNPDPGMLPGRGRFDALMGTIGLKRGQPLVAYDDEHGVFAARLVVTAFFYGHDPVYLLDGDFTAWSRSRRTDTLPVDVSPTQYRASIPADRPLIDADAVREAIPDPSAVLVDTRTPEEFAAGHIEGAVNLDWRDLVDPETRGIKPRAALETRLTAAGILPKKRIVLYCNTARRISHTYLVLRHLDYPSVDFYEGSLTDWRKRELPLVQEV